MNGKTDKMQDNDNHNNEAHGSGPKHSARPDDARPKPKRFYKTVSIVKSEGIVESEGGAPGYTLMLDDRPVKTPLKHPLLIQAKPLAEAVAKEWDDQREVIDPETMILTKLVNTSLDRVAPRRAEIIAEITSFAASDLLCYRAAGPAPLIEREAAAWDPYLTWARETIDVSLKTINGIAYIEQDPFELQKLAKWLENNNDITLTAAHNITTLTGSAMLTLALLAGGKDPQAVWDAAHVDEDYQIEQWGTDEEAARRRELRHQEYLKTHEFYQLSLI